MKINYEKLVLYFIILSFLFYTFIATLKFSSMSIKYFPLFVISATSILMISLLIKDIFFEKNENSSNKKVDIKSDLKVFFWLFFLSLLVLLIGLKVGTTLFVALFLLIKGKQKINVVLLSTGIMFLVAQLLFSTGLHIRLYPGLIPKIIGIANYFW